MNRDSDEQHKHTYDLTPAATCLALLLEAKNPTLHSFAYREKTQL
jgi:hypothetical protein